MKSWFTCCWLFIFPLVIACSVISCSSGANLGLFVEPTVIGVDSINNRVFILETSGRIFVLTADDLTALGEQPIVDATTLTTIHDLLPTTPTDIAVFPNGANSRLFIAGPQLNSAGDGLVQNRVLVLDYDGSGFGVASVSPLEITDAGASLDNSSVGGLVLDTANETLYISNAGAGLLHAFDVNDGSAVLAPVVIAGRPNKLSLANSQIYIANASDNATEQLINVFHTDNASTTAIDLDIATNDVAAVANATGTLLVVKQATAQSVLIRQVTTDFTTSSSIASATIGFNNGSLAISQGISSAVGSLIATKSGETLYAYIPQSDGNTTVLSVSADLSSYSATTLASTSQVIAGGAVYEDSAGNGLTVYLAGKSSGDLVFSDVGTATISARFLEWE